MSSASQIDASQLHARTGTCPKENDAPSTKQSHFMAEKPASIISYGQCMGWSVHGMKLTQFRRGCWG